MRHFLAITVAALFLLQGCTDAQKTSLINAATNFNRAVDNFNAVADAYDNSVATRVSPTLARYCSSAITSGRQLTRLAPNSGIARDGLVAVTTATSSWCTNPQTQTVGDAIAAMLQAAADAQDAVKRARSGA